MSLPAPLLPSPEFPVANLVLADGTVVQGYSFGAQQSIAGEVVFNTGMVGYPEALTDPSYRGQILVLTYPLIGNYGVPDSKITDEFGLPKFFESNTIHIAGLIIADYSPAPSHWACKEALGEWLARHNIPALFGLDTRMLAKKLRSEGSMLGKVEFPESPIEFVNPNELNLVAEVSVSEPVVYGQGNSPRVLAYDCGMKYNIIRYFLRHGVELTVVPFDFPLSPADDGSGDADSAAALGSGGIAADGSGALLSYFQGVFVSNGPGNPEMAAATIATLTSLLGKTKPIFGICLGNQLLALAAGGRTYKLKYGNRGMNQPAIDVRTTRCYITSQNHGFAVDTDSLPSDWRPLFLNANDGSNEGIMHGTLPFMGVQFHPEAAGGPMDTDFLFQSFLTRMAGNAPALTTVAPSKFERFTVSKVLLLGSGGLSIGQAGEFDYSGSQGIKALKEEGIQVIVINPNIATVQTSNGLADKVYFLPVTREFVLQVLEKERPDGILVSMGGQTALNVGVQMYEAGDFERYSVRVLGTPIPTIVATEDREEFARRLANINESAALSESARSVEEAVAAATRIGYPVLVRAAFALGGLGSGFAEDEPSLRTLAEKALSASPQILIDQDLRGWKEVEYEVVRDAHNNAVTVCNMENFDPLGIHTGDSIVVAPSQTLSNREYFMLRSASLKIVRDLGVVGECNVQFALCPDNERYCVIEVNARLSRSSALASKATGYPLAYVAAKLSLGLDLVDIRNSVTRTTTACFEPSLDYVVVKAPRFDLSKFERVSCDMGSSMKSVGEVMAIGRTFPEAIQKASRMVNAELSGFQQLPPSPATARVNAEGQRLAEAAGATDEEGKEGEAGLDYRLSHPDHQRLFALAEALHRGYSIDRLHALTKIDRWFLSKLQQISVKTLALESLVSGGDGNGAAALASLDAWAIRDLKKNGFSDKQIGQALGGVGEMSVRSHRLSLGVTPFVKQIDTLAAEFPAQTNYLYLTYSASASDDTKSVGAGGLCSGGKSAEDMPGVPTGALLTDASLPDDCHGLGGETKRRSRGMSSLSEGDGVPDTALVLGCGAYCIGSSVEFDWCAVSCVRALQAAGKRAVVVNYNPETVSTDYDVSDALYFEEVSLERVMDIYALESAGGVVVSVGGQGPNNLALPLHREGIRVLGTSPIDIDRAEDRHKFSALLDDLGVAQPAWKQLTSVEDALEFAAAIGYPVLVRPSYVLSGAAMRVTAGPEALSAFLQSSALLGTDHPVVVSKFIDGAKEVEFDAVANKGKVLNYAISEHVENAGVHSGDATLVLPAQKLYVETIRQVKRISGEIAAALHISGPFNIQFMSKNNDVMVIECNLRASRTFPFASKTFNFNFITLATRVLAGLPAPAHRFSLLDLDYVGIKAPQFSFTRLQGADPTLGVEMASTGEVACYGRDMYEAFLKALLSAGFKLPNATRNILLSLGSEHDKREFADSARQLVALGYHLFGTQGTATFLSALDIPIVQLSKPGQEVEGQASVLEFLSSGQLDLVVNVPDGSIKDEVTAGYLIRRQTVDFGVSLITNIKCALLLVLALGRVRGLHPHAISDYYGTTKKQDSLAW